MIVYTEARINLTMVRHNLIISSPEPASLEPPRAPTTSKFKIELLKETVNCRPDLSKMCTMFPGRHPKRRRV